MNFSSVILFLLLNTFNVSAQKIVKKDSSNIIPHRSLKYYLSDENELHSIENDIKFQHYLYPSFLNNPVPNLLGNIGTEVFPLLYQNTFYQKISSGRNLLNPYFFTENNIPYYLTNKAISEIGFVFYGNGNEIFQGFLTQNISQKVNIGIGINRSNNKGYYLYNQTLHNNLYITISHQSKRLKTNLQVLYNDAKVRENGGNTFGIYDSTGYKDWVYSPTQLTDGQNNFLNYNISLKNRYLIVPQKRMDTAQDSFLMKPIQSLFYIENNFNIGRDKNYYADTVLSENKNYYVSMLDTFSSTKVISLYDNNYVQNNISLHSDIKGLGRLNCYQQTIFNSIARGGQLDSIYTTNRNLILAIGGNFEIDLPYRLQWKNSFYKPFTGYTKNDVEFKSTLSQSNKFFKSQLQIGYQSQLPGYFYTHWESSTGGLNSLLVNQKTIFIEGKWTSDKYKFSISAQNYNIFNYLYLDTTFHIKQLDKNSIFQVMINKELSYKSLFLNTSISYQSSYNNTFNIKQTVAFYNKAFKENLKYYVGFDCIFNPIQTIYSYNPILMQNSNLMTPYNAKFFPIVNFFATLKINAVMLSLTYNNVLSSILQNGTYTALNYPIIPGTFYLSTKWRFLE